MRQVGGIRGAPVAIACLALTLGLAACGTDGSSSGTSSPPADRPTTLAATKPSSAPTCKEGWIKVSIPHPNANKAIVTTTGTENVVVTTTERCSLRGWPSFEQVKRTTGTTRPTFAEQRYGTAETVTILPDRPATARVTVRLPKRWAWGGGNLCAGFISATVSVPHLAKRYYVFDASPIFPLCGMPSGTLVHLSAWPFRPNTGGASAP